MKWYYPPTLGGDLSTGFETFEKHDDSADEHLDSLLKTIAAHEQETQAKIDAQVVTWRGMMTKVRRGSRSKALHRCTHAAQIMSLPYEDRDGYEILATCIRNVRFGPDVSVALK